MLKRLIYFHIKNKEYWARPLTMFNSLVDKEKYPDVKQKYRFELADSEYKLPEVHTSEITDFYLRQSKESR